MAQATKRSIIKDSSKIRKLLKERFDDLHLTSREIVNDAKEKGQSFTESSLSKYMKHGNSRNSLSEEAIIWLSVRYGVEIRLVVGKLTLVNGKLTVIDTKYNEKKCIEKLKQLFPWKTKEEI